MKSFASSLLSLWKQLGLNQRVSLVVAAVAVAGALAAVVLWSRQPDFQLLYGRLSEKDAAQIISSLQAQNIPHKIANGGATVYVPADQVYRLRMELASKGVPNGDGVGFEIFDKGQFGLSDFVQRTNYLRALQGELGRTIGQLDGVRSARVMIVQPENRLLLTEQGVKPTASVFVELAGGRLETEAVNSIRHLVANAVQGLQPDQVAVVDQKGRVLSEDLRQDPMLSTASSQMRYRQQIENYLAHKVETMLTPVVGLGNAVVRVSAEIETEATTMTQEKYDPDGQVVRSQTSTDDISNSSESRSGGVVGVTANTPDKPGAASSEGNRPANVTETNRKNRTTTYEINRSITNVTRQPGSLKNVTASVFVAMRAAAPAAPATPPAEGAAPAAPVPQPRTPEELQALRQIVVNALGLRPAPGQALDTLVSLQEVAFQVEPIAEKIGKIESATRVQSWIDGASRYFAVAVALGVLFVFWRMLGKQKPESVPVELLTASPRDAQRQLQSNGTLTPELLNELIRQKPVNIGTALKDWVAVKKS
jgi:flagellar M-ring protein FliF